MRIGGGGGPGLRFHGRIDDVRIYDRVLSEDEIAAVATAESVGEIARQEPGKRSPPQATKLRWAFVDRFAPADVRNAWQRLQTAVQRRQEFLESVSTVMVMEELPQPRNTFVLFRGAYDKPGEKVGPGVPSSLPPLPVSAPANRLGLARWLVHPSHPLTARVTVNRYWQMLFGTGLVKTAEDFGVQGERLR